VALVRSEDGFAAGQTAPWDVKTQGLRGPEDTDPEKVWNGIRYVMHKVRPNSSDVLRAGSRAHTCPLSTLPLPMPPTVRLQGAALRMEESVARWRRFQAHGEWRMREVMLRCCLTNDCSLSRVAGQARRAVLPAVRLRRDARQETPQRRTHLQVRPRPLSLESPWREWSRCHESRKDQEQGSCGAAGCQRDVSTLLLRCACGVQEPAQQHQLPVCAPAAGGGPRPVGDAQAGLPGRCAQPGVERAARRRGHGWPRAAHVQHRAG